MAEFVNITFALSVRGEMHLCEGRESSPAITVYTDDSLRTSMQRRLLTRDWKPLTLTMRSRKLSPGKYLEMFARSQLALRGTTVLRTKVGLTAVKYAGYARISLAMVFAEPGREHSLDLVVSLLDEEDRSTTLPKGTIVVRADSPILIDGVAFELGIPLSMAQTQWEHRLKVRHHRFAGFRKLIAQWQELFAAYPQTFPAAKNINCYIMRTEDGMIVPSIGYLKQPLPLGSNAGYYENALDIVVRRERLSRDELAALEITDRRLGSIAMQMLALWCNYVPYVSDQAWVPVKAEPEQAPSKWARLVGKQSKHHIDMKHFDMEEFEAAELDGNDDCEGVGAVIVRHHGYVLSIPANKRSPALNKVCELLAHYSPLLLLCGVTSGDLGGDFAALTRPDAKMGAHMFALFVPTAQLVRMIKRVVPAFEAEVTSPPGLQILCGEGTGLLAPIALDLPEQKRLLLPPRIIQTASMPTVPGTAEDGVNMDAVVIDDGRGMRLFSSVLGTRNPVFSVNSLFMTDLFQAYYTEVLAAGVRKWYHITRRPGLASHFYRTVQLALTPALQTLTSPVYSLVFMQKSSEESNDWSIGCTFNDLLSDGETGHPGQHIVGAHPEAAPDEQQMADLLDEMRLEPRPPTLCPPPERLGVNNTWDPTAQVPSAHDHETMSNIIETVRRAALIAELRSMRHAIAHSSAANYVGTPHLLSSCDCERQLATRLARAGDRAFVGVDALIEQFRTAMLATSMPESDPDRRQAIVVEPAFNYEQWMQRGPKLVDIVSTPIALHNAVIMPAGLHADFEHVTATTGGVMPQIFTLVQY